MLLQFISKRVMHVFSSMSSIVSSFTFRSLIHFEFIFVSGVREWLLSYPLLFGSILFSLHIFVVFALFLVIYSLSHSVVVEIDAADDFSFLKFTQACFVAQQVVNPGEHSMCM